MKKIVLILLYFTLLYGCNNDIMDEISEEHQEVIEFKFSEKDLIQGRMRIKLKEEPVGEVALRSSDGEVTTGIRALDNSTTILRVTRIKRTFPHAGKFEERSRREGLHLWYDIWFSEEIAATRATNEIAIIEDIEIATPVLKVTSNAISEISPYTSSITNFLNQNNIYPFNDTELYKQWSYYNAGNESWQEAGADIRIFDVWQQYNGHPDIIVAIMDGGIALDNPDIQANLWINPNEIAGNGLDDDNNGYEDDVHGYNFVTMDANITPHRHGTHVAGTIGAINNNGIGVCGIAGGDGTPNSGVKLMSCQIFQHPNGNYNSDIVSENIAEAIKYAADNGAVISQNSWGYAADSEAEYSYLDPAHKAAIDYFIKYAGCDNFGNQLPNSPMKGGIVLFAAGNNNSSSARISAPADYIKVLGVGSVGPDYIKAPYSNYGDYIDICGPGGLANSEKGIYSTTIAAYPYNYYEYRYGTSMSCPHVAGVAALLIEKHGVGKRGFTAQQLEEILLSTAYDLDAYNPNYAGKLGSGCVDAQAALQAELPNSSPFALKTTTVTDGILSFRVNSELAGNATVTIRNSIGNKVFSKNLNVKRYTITSIDINNISAGYYTLEYEYNKNKVKESFIKY